ncbi:GNAT family N-acetyltransferase [Thioclava sp. F28-4]|uniref:GNAT family N-acetyltransferase n=1 Tax=Thioclava sp. F28-4 TaxID=1915315 RepID=UPI000996A244|nr:GNAT family N-acetyltransferase [Thioclava sp. F28-4]OOY02930.1 GNAT family N-acetyltransferase [Thioclava sp. F28-4]
MTRISYETVSRVPSVAEYMRLRSVAGLSAFSEEAAGKGLAGTLYAVVIEHEGAAVGMGRLIGDGGCFVQVVDIAVDPRYQGQGLGKAIMSELTSFITEHLPASAYISLIADIPANSLYEKFGFEETAPRSVGMARRAG